MFFGDIVTITSKGVLAREKALLPLGIYDESICWGLWAANPHPEHPQTRHPNLIISPFHPSSWPFLVRLRLVLENRPGALADAARLLEDNDLSVLFAECTPTGFTHATWSVIAESTWDALKGVRERKEEFDRREENQRVRIPPDESYGEAREMANDIAAHMLAHVRRLDDVFAKVVAGQKAGPDPPLFHLWSAEGDSHFLYNGDKVARKMERLRAGPARLHREYIRSLIPAPAEVNYMQRLAYFSLYGGGDIEEVPFQFRYHADTTLIERLRGTAFEHGSFPLAPLPMPAIATFNSEDKYLRLCPVTPNFLKRSLTRLVVGYGVTQKRHNARASQGLLRRICDALPDDVDLLHVSNKRTSPDYAEEKGEIFFIADADRDKHGRLEQTLRGINDAGKAGRLGAVTIKDTRVYEYPQKKLFLSRHRGHPREDSVRELVIRAARDRGFVHVEVNTFTEPVTESVNRQIRDSQAFLQLLYSDVDPDKIDFNWLQHEYSTALAIGMPVLRLVDTCKFDYEKWKLQHKVNPGVLSRPFRLDVSDADLEKEIRAAIATLAEMTRGGD
jgi:hypothetical protein